MNNIAIMPYIGLHALQIQNVKRNVAKKVSINELNNEVIPPNNDTPNEEVKKDIDNSNIGTHMNDSHNPLPVAVNSSSTTFGSEINNID